MQMNAYKGVWQIKRSSSVSFLASKYIHHTLLGATKLNIYLAHVQLITKCKILKSQTVKLYIHPKTSSSFSV